MEAIVSQSEEKFSPICGDALRLEIVLVESAF